MIRFNLLDPREGPLAWPLPGRLTVVDPSGRFEIHVYGLGYSRAVTFIRKVGPWRAI